MFDRDKWSEIWVTISRNKLRSFLTMLGVSWGIFLLIAVLGMGKGLQNGTLKGFDGWATNSMFIWTMRTSMPFEGFKRGRRINFHNADIDAIKQHIEGVEIVAPRLQLGGWRGSNNIVYKNKTGAFNVYGDIPEILQIEAMRIIDGRFHHHRDLRDANKVCVIGTKVRNVLFDGTDPIGEYIKIQGVYFRVVGVFEPKASSDMGESKDAAIYIPFSTFQKAFNSLDMVHWFSITGEPGAQVSEIQDEVKLLMAKRLKVDPKDPMAFGSWNMQEMFQQMNMLFIAIAGLGWFVGILTLIAGVIGVSNIMMVIIKERTKEIGIRRSIGATPGNITGQIVLEAITLTFVAGAFGLMAGIALLELVNSLELEGDFFASPEVDLSVALVALSVLIFSGLIAGYIPARKALRINTVDALRAE